MSKTKADIAKLAQEIIAILEEHKAINCELIDLEERSALADFFVICNGTSSTHVRALANNLEKELSEDFNLAPASAEGYGSREWVLLDYLDIIVHIFTEETRAYYDLERLWTQSEEYVER